jgi:hypothetical protein
VGTRCDAHALQPAPRNKSQDVFPWQVAQSIESSPPQLLLLVLESLKLCFLMILAVVHVSTVPQEQLTSPASSMFQAVMPSEPQATPPCMTLAILKVSSEWLLSEKAARVACARTRLLAPSRYALACKRHTARQRTRHGMGRLPGFPNSKPL